MESSEQCAYDDSIEAKDIATTEEPQMVMIQTDADDDPSGHQVYGYVEIQPSENDDGTLIINPQIGGLDFGGQSLFLAQTGENNELIVYLTHEDDHMFDPAHTSVVHADGTLPLDGTELREETVEMEEQATNGEVIQAEEASLDEPRETVVNDGRNDLDHVVPEGIIYASEDVNNVQYDVEIKSSETEMVIQSVPDSEEFVPAVDNNPPNKLHQLANAAQKLHPPCGKTSVTQEEGIVCSRSYNVASVIVNQPQVVVESVPTETEAKVDSLSEQDSKDSSSSTSREYKMNNAKKDLSSEKISVPTVCVTPRPIDNTVSVIHSTSKSYGIEKNSKISTGNFSDSVKKNSCDESANVFDNAVPKSFSESPDHKLVSEPADSEHDSESLTVDTEDTDSSISGHGVGKNAELDNSSSTEDAESCKRSVEDVSVESVKEVADCHSKEDPVLETNSETTMDVDTPIPDEESKSNLVPGDKTDARADVKELKAKEIFCAQTNDNNDKDSETSEEEGSEHHPLEISLNSVSGPNSDDSAHALSLPDKTVKCEETAEVSKKAEKIKEIVREYDFENSSNSSDSTPTAFVSRMRVSRLSSGAEGGFDRQEPIAKTIYSNSPSKPNLSFKGSLSLVEDNLNKTKSIPFKMDCDKKETTTNKPSTPLAPEVETVKNGRIVENDKVKNSWAVNPEGKESRIEDDLAKIKRTLPSKEEDHSLLKSISAKQTKKEPQTINKVVPKESSKNSTVKPYPIDHGPSVKLRKCKPQMNEVSVKLGNSSNQIEKRGPVVDVPSNKQPSVSEIHSDTEATASDVELPDGMVFRPAKKTHTQHKEISVPPKKQKIELFSDEASTTKDVYSFDEPHLESENQDLGTLDDKDTDFNWNIESKVSATYKRKRKSVRFPSLPSSNPRHRRRESRKLRPRPSHSKDNSSGAIKNSSTVSENASDLGSSTAEDKEKFWGTYLLETPLVTETPDEEPSPEPPVSAPNPAVTKPAVPKPRPYYSKKPRPKVKKWETFVNEVPMKRPRPANERRKAREKVKKQVFNIFNNQQSLKSKSNKKKKIIQKIQKTRVLGERKKSLVTVFYAEETTDNNTKLVDIFPPREEPASESPTLYTCSYCRFDTEKLNNLVAHWKYCSKEQSTSGRLISYRVNDMERRQRIRGEETTESEETPEKPPVLTNGPVIRTNESKPGCSKNTQEKRQKRRATEDAKTEEVSVKNFRFRVNDVVWLKLDGNYWPALIRKLTKEEASLYMIDLPLSKCGVKIKSFDFAECIHSFDDRKFTDEILNEANLENKDKLLIAVQKSVSFGTKKAIYDDSLIDAIAHFTIPPNVQFSLHVNSISESNSKNSDPEAKKPCRSVSA